MDDMTRREAINRAGLAVGALVASATVGIADDGSGSEARKKLPKGKKPKTYSGERTIESEKPFNGEVAHKAKEDHEFIESIAEEKAEKSRRPEERLVHDRPANCVWLDSDTSPSTLHWYSNYNNTTYCGDEHFWTANWQNYESTGGTCSDGCPEYRVRYY